MPYIWLTTLTDTYINVFYSKGVIYRDISANNILVSEKRNLLLKGEASFASNYIKAAGFKNWPIF